METANEENGYVNLANNILIQKVCLLQREVYKIVRKIAYLIANFNAYRKSLKKNAKRYLTIFGICHKLKNNITFLQQQNDLKQKDVVQTKMYQDESIHIAIILFWKT